MALDPVLAGKDAWGVVLALFADERTGLEIADAGAYHVLAPLAELEVGRLERLVCEPSSA